MTTAENQHRPLSPLGRHRDGQQTPASPPHSDPAAAMRDLVLNMGYEVMPFKGTEESVAKHVDKSVPLTVTTTEAKGISATLELTERLRGRGYDVAPHLAARQVANEDELAAIVARLKAAGIDRAFVIGGDARDPAGKYVDALGFLEDLRQLDHGLLDIGIGGYPEGHGSIDTHLVETAIEAKASHATRVVTQICFDADATATWGEALVDRGVTLPVYVGMPGPVNRQKLVRISAGIGLGQSARFLQKQQGLWRFFLPGAYNPTRLVKALSREAATHAAQLHGLHIFTFNELEGTEKWRLRLRSQLGIG